MDIGSWRASETLSGITIEIRGYGICLFVCLYAWTYVSFLYFDPRVFVLAR